MYLRYKNKNWLATEVDKQRRVNSDLVSAVNRKQVVLLTSL